MDKLTSTEVQYLIGLLKKNQHMTDVAQVILGKLILLKRETQAKEHSTGTPQMLSPR